MQVATPENLRRAVQHLQTHDPHLAPVIAHVGPCTLKPHSNYYQELVESIIGQQLSIKAAATITQRFVTLFGGVFPMPQDILAKPFDQLRTVGLSKAKATYIQDLAHAIIDGRLEINKLPELPNDAIIAELTSIRGIGHWTAHMFLIFSLGRLDILPVGDLGIKNGLQRLYQLLQVPGPGEITTIAQQFGWHPYESVASWYVWQSLSIKEASDSSATDSPLTA